MAKLKTSKEQLPYSIDKIEFNIVDYNYLLRGKIKLIDWIKKAILKEKRLPGPISFNFCSDEYLLGINKQYLNHNYYTDIITFDFCEGMSISGDIYISIERIKENAKNEHKTFSNELRRVIIHGILHLCGYKDKKPADTRQMRQKEDYYLSLLQ
jgi:probable rRNA maturation factor